MGNLINKTLDVIERVAESGHCSLPELAERCAIPISTAHRIVRTLIERGYIVAEQRGRYRLGSQWIATGHPVSFVSLLRDISRRPLGNLARECRAHTHLAILDGDMVTYLVKQRFGRAHIHSEEDMQLEAYCSAIGKVLLAQLPEDSLAAYLDSGEFVALTPLTITNPKELASHLIDVRLNEWAAEVGETEPNLMCLAVPIIDRGGHVHAAISISFVDAHPSREALLQFLPPLNQARGLIEEKAFPSLR